MVTAMILLVAPESGPWAKSCGGADWYDCPMAALPPKREADNRRSPGSLLRPSQPSDIMAEEP
jgi:hypothetical protein